MSKDRSVGRFHRSNEEADSHPRSAGEPDRNVGVVSDSDRREGAVEKADGERIDKRPSRQLMLFDKIRVYTAVGAT
jgi:hypothetical protein